MSKSHAASLLFTGMFVTSTLWLATLIGTGFPLFVLFIVFASGWAACGFAFGGEKKA